MPIILTTAILVVPSYVSNLGLLPKVPINWNLLHFFIGLVILHSTIQFVLFDNCFKSKDISDQLQKMAVTIPEFDLVYRQHST
jgi:hypothetical protein